MTLARKSAAMMAIVLAITSSAHALTPMKALETSIETATGGLNLPSSVPANLSLRPCNACDLVTLQLATTSEFFIGKETVTFARFTTYAKASSRGLTIHYTPETKVVTRMVASQR